MKISQKEKERIIEQYLSEKEFYDNSLLRKKYRKLLTKFGLIKQIPWEKIAAFEFQLIDGGDNAKVVYLDSHLQPIGEELIDHLIRKNIDEHIHMGY